MSSTGHERGEVEDLTLSTLEAEDIEAVRSGESSSRSSADSRKLVLIGSLSLTALLVGGVVGGVAVWRGMSERLSDPEFLQRQLQSVQPENGEENSGPPPALVRVALAEHKKFQSQREIIGRLVEVRKVTVASEVTGKVIAMPVEEGTGVIGGETILAQIDDTWSRLAKERIEAQIASAEVPWLFEKAELDRLQKLTVTNEDAITASELESKKATVDELKATIDASRIALQEEEERIARSIIRAPFDGIVVVKHAESGGHVSVGTPIVEIISSGELEARLMVPESVVNLLEVGQELPIRIDPLQEEVPGRVASVTPYGPMASRTFPVEVRVDDQGGRLKAGMSVTASIPMGGERDALVVSRDAVLVRPDGATVWVAVSSGSSRSAEVQPVPVTVSARMRDQYAVEPETADGGALLVDGAAVVVEGAERLKPGQTVGIVELNDMMRPDLGSDVSPAAQGTDE